MLDKEALERKARDLENNNNKEENNTRGTSSLELSSRIDKDPTKFDSFHSNFVKDYVPKRLQSKMLKDADKTQFRNDVIEYSSNTRLRAGKICKPDICTDAKIGACPFVNLGKEYIPEGERCPMELMEIDALRDTLTDILINECGADEKMVKLHIRELVAVELNLTRIDDQIANRGVYEDSPIFALPKSETVIMGKIASPMFSVQDQLVKRKMNLYKMMLITPESRARYNLREEKDMASIIGEIKLRAARSVSAKKPEKVIGYIPENEEQHEEKEK